MFTRISVSVCVTALAGVLFLLGFFLALKGMAILPGAFFIGSHAFGAAAIAILLGLVSLTSAGLLCFGLFRYWFVLAPDLPNELKANRTDHAEARLHVLDRCDDSGPLYSGFRSTFRYHDIVDDVSITLVGVGQLIIGEDGNVLLSFANPARHFAYLREGCEFDILDHNKHRICSGTIERLLDLKETSSGASPRR